MDQIITTQNLETFHKDFRSQPLYSVSMHAACANGLLTSAEDEKAPASDRHEYSISLEQGDITDQKHSGRCWMFAALNTFRFQVIKKLNLKTFELSQNYTLFYDKLEKSNYFLESILDTLDEPTDGRLVSFLLQDPVGDGGQWDMFVNIIKKYGVVPKEAMPETKNSSNTGDLDNTLTYKLREYACRIRSAYADGTSVDDLKGMKEEMMCEVYRLLCICLGEPPKSVDLEVRDKDNNFIRDLGLTPQEFYDKYVGLNLDDYISLINAPTADKPYHRSYTVKYLGNVKEGRIVRYLNLEIDELKKAAIAQLKDGYPVWFGCDVGKDSSRNGGILDTNIYKKEDMLGFGFGMTKGQRLDYGESQMTHAMVFQGVNLDDEGKPNRWRVENSWGEEPGKKGYYVMTDEWFDQHMYQVVVNRKYLSKELLAEYDSEPIALQPWDPMGSLA